MQKDMHYYGTLAVALAAGIEKHDAETIAFASQYVDDSTERNSEEHKDGGLLYGIATAHHPLDCALNRIIDKDQQRRVWVPFHFVPGGQGNSFQEKLICQKNSKIVREMFENHIEVAVSKDYRLELIGIAAHAFMDTFSHYGFSGISSEHNYITGNPNIKATHDERIKKYVWEKYNCFMETYVKQKAETFSGLVAQTASDGLGHGGVATFPDRPFLEWEFYYAINRPGKGKCSKRRNYQDYLEACAELYDFFNIFAKKYYADTKIVRFAGLYKQIQDILGLEGTKEERIDRWKRSGLIEDCKDYLPETWEQDKARFSHYRDSSEAIRLSVYRFHQAAAHHRYYMLKDLLPKYGIAVY